MGLHMGAYDEARDALAAMKEAAQATGSDLFAHVTDDEMLEQLLKSAETYAGRRHDMILDALTRLAAVFETTDSPELEGELQGILLAARIETGDDLAEQQQTRMRADIERALAVHRFIAATATDPVAATARQTIVALEDLRDALDSDSSFS
jgi:hypothetical protein